jgi:four helix bundle protein
MRGSYTELRVWQEAHALSLRVYLLIKQLPSSERVNLGDQMRRASTSIAATIAEGVGRDSPKDFRHFLVMARGSAHEMMNHCIFAKDSGLLPKDAMEELIGRYRGLAAGIYAYMIKIKNRP